MKVAIIGMGDGRHWAPWADPEWEFWGMNHLFLLMPLERWPWTRWFELHAPHQLKDRREERLAWLSEDHGIPVYTKEDYSEDWPNSVPLPVGDLLRLGPRGHYHCGTYDWMVALALRLGAKHIGIFGSTSLELEAGEPRSARACLEYWCGFAEAQGVTVECWPGNVILRNYERAGGMYPWDRQVMDEGERPPALWLPVEQGEQWADWQYSATSDWLYYRGPRKELDRDEDAGGDTGQEPERSPDRQELA